MLNQPEKLCIVEFCFLFVHLQQNSLKFISQTEKKKDSLFLCSLYFLLFCFVIAECLLSGSPLEKEEEKKLTAKKRNLCNVSGFQVDCTFNNIVEEQFSRLWRKKFFSSFWKINWQFNIEKFNSVFVKENFCRMLLRGWIYVEGWKVCHSFNIQIRVNAVE